MIHLNISFLHRQFYSLFQIFIQQERIRKQKEEEEKRRRKKDLELKEFVDELGLANSNSTQIFELLSKEHFDVETLLNTPVGHLQLLFPDRLALGIQAKIFGLIEKRKVEDARFFVEIEIK